MDSDFDSHVKLPNLWFKDLPCSQADAVAMCKKQYQVYL